MNAKVKFLLKLGFTIVLVSLILKTVGLSQLLTGLRGIHLSLFFLACLIAPVFLFLKVSKWGRLVKEEIPDVSFISSIKSFLAGWGIALLTPARVGELARILYFTSGSKVRLAFFVLLDKIFDLTTLIFLSLFGIGLFLGLKEFFLFLLLGLIILFLLFKQSMLILFIKRFSFILPFKNKIKDFSDNWKPLQAKTILICLSYTLVAFILTLFQSYLLVNSFEPLTLKIVFLVFPLVVLSNALPVTIGGIGVREGIAALLLSMFGVSKTAAVNSAFLLFFINTLVPGLIGALFAPNLKFKMKNKED